MPRVQRAKRLTFVKLIGGVGGVGESWVFIFTAISNPLLLGHIRLKNTRLNITCLNQPEKYLVLESEAHLYATYISKPYFGPKIQIFSHLVEPCGHFFGLMFFFLHSGFGLTSRFFVRPNIRNGAHSRAEFHLFLIVKFLL